MATAWLGEVLPSLLEYSCRPERGGSWRIRRPTIYANSPPSAAGSAGCCSIFVERQRVPPYSTPRRSAFELPAYIALVRPCKSRSTVAASSHGRRLSVHRTRPKGESVPMRDGTRRPRRQSGPDGPTERVDAAGPGCATRAGRALRRRTATTSGSGATRMPPVSPQLVIRRACRPENTSVLEGPSCMTHRQIDLCRHRRRRVFIPITSASHGDAPPPYAAASRTRAADPFGIAKRYTSYEEMSCPSIFGKMPAHQLADCGPTR